MTVELLYNTPLWVCSRAIRKCMLVLPNGNIIGKRGKPLRPRPNKAGYLRVQNGRNGGDHTVHKLVATYYIPKQDNKTEVNHRDGNKKNNHVNNLEWVTRQENMRCRSIQGLAYYGALNIDEWSEVLEAYSTGLFTQLELADNTGISRSHLSNTWRNLNAS